jgi:thioredoxin 1
MNMVKVNGSNFKQEVIESKVPVLLDFYADWCGPCRIIAPVLEGIAGRYAGKLKVCKLDVDNAQDIAVQYNVSSIPTVLLLKNGRPVDGFIGAQPESAIEKLITSNL